MSYDVAVWYSEAPMTVEQAASFYQHIARDWVVVQRAAAFDAFMEALRARVPPGAGTLPPLSPDAVPPALLTAWDDLRRRTLPADAPAAGDALPTGDAWSWIADLAPCGSTVVGWIPSEEAWTTTRELAAAHGLIFFDPQSADLVNPPGLDRPVDPDALTVHLVMTIEGRPPALTVRIALDGETILDTAMPSRADAHAGARVIALAHDLAFYAVEDAATLAQSFRAVEPAEATLPPGQATIVEYLQSLRPDATVHVLQVPPDAPDR
jgi:hypothetical protein